MLTSGFSLLPFFVILFVSDESEDHVAGMPGFALANVIIIAKFISVRLTTHWFME